MIEGLQHTALVIEKAGIAIQVVIAVLCHALLLKTEAPSMMTETTEQPEARAFRRPR